MRMLGNWRIEHISHFPWRKGRSHSTVISYYRDGKARKARRRHRHIEKRQWQREAEREA